MSKDRIVRATEFLRTWWETTNRGLRTFSIASWILGVLAVLAGLTLDATKAWDNLAFAPNIAASAAGALLGVPLALLFLQRLSNIQSEDFTRQRTIRLAKVTASELEQTVSSFWGPSGDRKAAELEQAMIRLTTTVNRPTYEFLDYEYDTAYLENLRVCIIQVDGAAREVFEIGALPALSHGLNQSWEFFKTQVRIKLAESGLPWFDAALVARLDSAVSRLCRDPTDISHGTATGARYLAAIDSALEAAGDSPKATLVWDEGNPVTELKNTSRALVQFVGTLRETHSIVTELVQNVNRIS